MARLTGLTVMVPESRELDLFAGMLEGEGARTVRCPLVTILDVADPAPVEAWLGRLIAGAFDDLILLTGEGFRRLMVVAERAGIKPEVVAAASRDPRIRFLGYVQGEAKGAALAWAEAGQGFT